VLQISHRYRVGTGYYGIEIDYNLSRRFEKFSAHVGIDDNSQDASAKATFVLVGDGKVLAEVNDVF